MGSIKHVTIYTDGATHKNGASDSVGGWGALIISEGHRKVISGRELGTTNNRMEMTAAIKALEAIKEPCSITLFTDSQYLLNGIVHYLKNWKRRGMKTVEGTDVKNKDLWERLEWLCNLHKVEWRWVKGHSGNEGNEMADRLARNAINIVGVPTN